MQTPHNELMNTLHSNLILQAAIQRRLIVIQQCILDNDEQCRLLSDIRRSRGRSRTTMSSSALLGVKRFIDADVNTPPESEAEIAFKSYLRHIPVIHHVTKWNSARKLELQRGVAHQNRVIRTRQVLKEQRQLTASMSDEDRRASVKAALKEIRELQVSYLLRNTKGVDWNRIQSVYVPSRSAEECRIQWLGNDDPRINKQKWSADECVRIVALSKKYDGYEWGAVARELNTNRTAMQCFTHYERHHVFKNFRHHWTPAADEFLVKLVNKYGERWRDVAMHFPSLSAAQVNYRYTNTSRSNITKGKWSHEEDRLLAFAQRAYGDQWFKIAAHVPGRTGVKCRERWCNVLSSAAQFSKSKIWTAEEDETLLRAVEQEGAGSWSRVAQVIDTARTDNQLYRRWKRIAPAKALAAYRQEHIRQIVCGSVDTNTDHEETQDAHKHSSNILSTKSKSST